MRRSDRIRLLYGWGYREDDFDSYGFSRGRSLEDASRYLGYDWYLRKVRPALNPDGARLLTENKWVFYRFVSGLGVPVPPTIGLFDAAHGTTWDGERPMRTAQDVLDELARRRPSTLVVKPAGGGQGQDVVIVDAIDHETGDAVLPSGERVTLEALLDGVDPAARRGTSGLIVQEAVGSHPEVQRLSPSVSNSVRVLTLVMDDGTVHVQAASARLGRQGGMADNWSRGGISVAVDVATGQMGTGNLKGSWDELTTHPDTGCRFSGEVLPLWPETLEVCRRAAVLMPGLRSIGWDVVITADGPVVLEGNSMWALQPLQWASEGFLADPAIRGQWEQLGVPMPTGSIARTLPGHVADRARKLLGRLT